MQLTKEMIEQRLRQWLPLGPETEAKEPADGGVPRVVDLSPLGDIKDDEALVHTASTLILARVCHPSSFSNYQAEQHNWTPRESVARALIPREFLDGVRPMGFDFRGVDDVAGQLHPCADTALLTCFGAIVSVKRGVEPGGETA